MKLQVKIPHPVKDQTESEAWLNPKCFKVKHIEVVDKLVWISPYRFGDLLGFEVAFQRPDYSTYWHFIDQSFERDFLKELLKINPQNKKLVTIKNKPMNKEQAKTVEPGDKLLLIGVHQTPGRKFAFPCENQEVEVRRIHKEPSGYLHFDIGLLIPENEPPLKSLDTGDEIDGSRIYWMHPTRFDFTVMR